METEKVIERVKQELAKITDKGNKIMFFVIDTKGNPSGSLSYIYKLAKYAKDDGYDVAMLYQKSKDEDFVGVGEWLGQEYADLEHICISDGELSVSPSDILFIPEIFANVMVQTKNLPCKRIAILQNYDYMVEQMPFSVQWGDLGIMECITNTEYNKEKINGVFPYVRTTVIQPNVENMFDAKSVGDTPRNFVVNVIAKSQSDINKIVKPFYWKFPMYRWVSFKDLRGMPKETYANELLNGEITVWVDTDSSFGYGGIEAIKAGNIVLAKRTDNQMPWYSVNGEPNDACIWFEDYDDLHKMLASVIRAVITDDVPEKVFEDRKAYDELYKEETTRKEFVEYLNNTIERRRKEIEGLLAEINNGGDSNEK